MDKDGDEGVGVVVAEGVGDTADDWEADDHSSRETPIAVLAGLIGPKPEEFELLLPSQLPTHLRRANHSRLLEAERRLRLAKLESSLRDLRRLLRIKAAVYLHKQRNNISQKGGTRAHTIMHRFAVKIASTAQRYRENRKAMLALEPNGTWLDRYKVLREEDIRAPQEDSGDIRVTLTTEDAREEERQQGFGPDSVLTAFPNTGRDTRTNRGKKRKRGEGHRKLSWIWFGTKAPEANPTASGPLTESEPPTESDADEGEPLNDTTDEQVGDGA